MADVLTKAQRSKCMAAIRSSGNKGTQLRLISILRIGGLKGWRRYWPLFGRPDFVFPNKKMAIFVDGCFWHGCQRCFRAPKSNQVFWRKKLIRNRNRDVEVNRSLRANGWKVIRFWECDLRHHHLKVLSKLAKALR